MKRLLIIIAFVFAGCGIRGYHWASSGLRDTFCWRLLDWTFEK